MTDLILYISCGLSAGLLGGYLGLGGGIVMVPFLTVIAGLDILVAVPVSVTAIVVNSIASSNEYLRRGMVDLELVVVLAIFSVLGNVTGSLVSDQIPGSIVRIVLTVIIIYAAFSLFKNKKKEKKLGFADNRGRYLVVCVFVAYAVGLLAAIVGIGGGVVLVPMLYLVIGLPLDQARGTSSMMIGFSSAAASMVYLMNGRIEYDIVAPVIIGILIGGRLGGYLGTLAKPIVVKILFFLVMMYLAYRLTAAAMMGF